MSVQVYGCNHVAIEVDDVEKAVAFYKDVFNLEQMSGGEGDAFFKLGDHQFLAIFEVDKVQRANMRHFGIMVRDEIQLEEVRKKLTENTNSNWSPRSAATFVIHGGIVFRWSIFTMNHLYGCCPIARCRKRVSSSIASNRCSSCSNDTRTPMAAR
jgi:extradiol dioxygenase family protein